jgi:acyl-CoA synthetase (AMP-forming)/AMP-acid ligase II
MQLLDRLTRHAMDHPDRLALREIATGRTMTYRQLADAVRDFRSDETLLRCGNRCDFHVAFLAAMRAGRTIFPIAPDTVQREIDAVSAKASQCGDGAALLLQSSGTTGLPKIVCRDDRSLDAVAQQMVEAIGIEADDHVLAAVPLCHSYGIEHGLLAPIWAGATVHLADGFDIELVRHELANSNITVFPAVPSIYEMLGNLPADVKFSALRLAYSAGGPLPSSVFESNQRHYNMRVGQLYGATEIGSVTFAHPRSPTFDPTSVGQPMRGVELKLDRDNQLLVRAASMMSNYVADASPLTPDGFFPTGDLAAIDANNNLRITGRIKFLIDVGGLKVNPMEVEQAILEHPAVAACVVVPMRLSETVYRLKAVLTPTDPADPPAIDSLRQFARERLTSHKIPRVFEIRQTLPRSATGKILRHLLVESA